MKIELVQNEDLTVKTKTGSTVTVPSPSADDTLATIADATLTDMTTFSEWTISPAGKFTDVVWSDEYGEFEWAFSFDEYPLGTGNHDPNATGVSAVDFNDGLTYTATRIATHGYRLGSQENKPLAPAGDYVRKSEAVSKSGDTMTGPLTVPSLHVTDALQGGFVLGSTGGQDPTYLTIEIGAIFAYGYNGREGVAVLPGTELDATNDSIVLMRRRDRNLLPYGASATLSTNVSVYRLSAAMTGTAASFPTLSYSGLPTERAYYQFEIELSVPDTATALSGPSDWTWMPGFELPSTGYAGKTVYVSCRIDLRSRNVLASCFRVGDPMGSAVEVVDLTTLAEAAGLTPTDTTTMGDIQTALGLADTATVQDAIDAAS